MITYKPAILCMAVWDIILTGLLVRFLCVSWAQAENLTHSHILTIF
jgi:hypothetical protein